MRETWTCGAAGAALTLLLAVQPAGAAAPTAASIMRGEAVAQARCAACHAIGPAGASPRPPAPPFRDLHALYPVADLIAALAEGASTGHPAMPQFHLGLRRRRDLSAYVQSLAR